MTAISRYVKMSARERLGKALAQRMLEVADGLRATAGCELYVINRSRAVPDVVWVTELWASQEALDAALTGLQTESGQAGMAEVMALLDGPPEPIELEPLGGVGYLPGGRGFTILNLDEVEDQAPRFGFGQLGEARFARQALNTSRTGVALHRLRPHARQAFGHRHQHAEEVYVVLSGGGRVKIDDEIHEISALDAIRLAPESTRAFEARTTAVTGPCRPSSGRPTRRMETSLEHDPYHREPEPAHTPAFRQRVPGPRGRRPHARGHHGRWFGRRAGEGRRGGRGIGEADRTDSRPRRSCRLSGRAEGAPRQLPGSWPTLKTTPDVRLAPGDRVGSLEVIASPGHTPGHVAFLDTRDRSLIGGDVFTTYGRPSVSSHFYFRFPFATMATWDRAKDIESAQALRELEPTVLVVGHGPAVRDPGSAMDQAIVRARQAAG
jgi:glyoxylase-like metal-dependent hydrolase (beta-lactamase superfamily II)/quinol monooxygenase YgiN/mannose-6-phosphate isomerase-like protein (cupin superfamily)